MFKLETTKLNKALGYFSIKDIEAVTGIKGHTIRIWEQRYGIVTPKRTATNIRYYDDGDLRALLNISMLNEHGIKISEIAKMTSDEVSSKVLDLCGGKCDVKVHIKPLVSAMMSFDEAEFHKLISTHIIHLGMEDCFTKIVVPFLTEVGFLWQVGSIQPSHEHFVSNIIKQKLYVAIDSQIGKFAEHRNKFLLFLPEKEKHSLGLLFANYIVRSRGHEVLFLGQEVPLVDLKSAFEKEQPDYILTMMTAAQPDMNKQDFINFLSENWPKSNIILTGFQFLQYEANLPSNVCIIKSMEDFISFVNKLSPSWTSAEIEGK